MTKDLQHIISELLSQSSQFNANDVLVNADISTAKLMEIDRNATFDLATFPKRILTDAKANLKETGVNTLCAAIGNRMLNKPNSIVC